MKDVTAHTNMSTPMLMFPFSMQYVLFMFPTRIRKWTKNEWNMAGACTTLLFACREDIKENGWLSPPSSLANTTAFKVTGVDLI